MNLGLTAALPFSTVKQSPANVLAPVALLLLVCSTSASRGDTINWVDYPNWNDGDTVGQGSSVDLQVTTTFELFSGTINSDSPRFLPTGVSISDPDWPFDNTVFPRWQVWPPAGGSPSYRITHEFTNDGGLPAGGSIAVMDLESPGSSVTFTGLREGAEVPVSWSVGFFEVSGANANFPIWNPSTQTLSGATSVDSSTRNFAFFISDTQLDSVVLDVEASGGDAIDFGIAAQTIPLAPVWNSSVTGAWTDAGNWQSTNAPNSDAALAIFGDIVSSPTTVVVDSPVTVQSIQFGVTTDSGAAQEYAIAGQAPLTLDSALESASIDVIDGHHNFQTVVELDVDADVDVAAGATLTFNNTLDLAGNTLVKTGLGELAIRNDLTVSGGTIEVLEGTLSGNGAVGGSLANDGTVAPGNSPGQLAVDGDYNQSSLGTLAIELGGLTQGEEYDQLDIAQTASLSGDLNVEFIDSFAPGQGDSFEILTADGGVTGVFQDGSLPSLGPGLSWVLEYETAAVMLSAVVDLAGDYDSDGDVDTDDYQVWRSSYGQSGLALGADGNRDGTVDAADYTVWRDNLGASVAALLSDAQRVPEPTGIGLLTAGLLLVTRRTKRASPRSRSLMALACRGGNAIAA